MTPEGVVALRRIVAELGADAGVLLRLTPSGACVVTSSTLGPELGVDDVWASPGSLSDTDLQPELVVDPDRLVRLVPAGVLRALGAEPSAALVAPLADTTLRIILLWTPAPPQLDIASAMESEAVHRFTELAPLFDAQARAHESATRLHQSICRPAQLVDQQLDPSASIGVAPALAGDTPTTLVSRADSALYQAKRLGRGQVAISPAE